MAVENTFLYSYFLFFTGHIDDIPGDADGKEKGSGSPSSSPDVRGSAVLLPTNLSSTSASVPVTSDTKAPIAPEELERRQGKSALAGSS